MNKTAKNMNKSKVLNAMVLSLNGLEGFLESPLRRI